MATRVIDDTKLNNIAVAIQAKDNGGQMTVDEMSDRIANIPSGGATLIPKTITENGIYNASSDNADGYDIVMVDVPEKNTLDDYFANTLEVADISSATSIVNDFFKNKSSLINVIMPNVTSIGNSAFNGCTNLALTALPDGITIIGGYAFNGCTNLALTALPDGITIIGNSTFWNCTNLALTALPDGITRIDGYAFGNCTNLALTALPDGITRIDNYAFTGCTGILYLDFSGFTRIPTLGIASFNGTAFPFYFRDQQQLDEWAAATNWSAYADRFQIKPSEVI